MHYAVHNIESELTITAYTWAFEFLLPKRFLIAFMTSLASLHSSIIRKKPKYSADNDIENNVNKLDI